MLPSLGDSDRELVLKSIPSDRGERSPKDGPIRTLLDQEPELAVELHLFSNDDSAIGKLFARWLGCKPQLHRVTIAGPTDYKSIYEVVDGEIGRILDSRRGIELNIHLSPGTPAMAAIWVLLGKSKYPARFWQTYSGKAWKTEIPFDLTLDVLPEVLRSADAPFHHLISRGPGQVDGFQSIAGDSSAIRLAVGRAQRAAFRDVSVLLLGESGTGKELFARAIHAASARRNKPFEVLNCAALPEQLLESELFGHTRGAFTGANRDRDGAFRRADGGTLFLDEIGECQPAIQAKLLRVLQAPPSTLPTTREFHPVGSDKPVRADVRIVAATNRNLPVEIQSGQFRGDLYYRLAAITIQLPPLRERKADIVPIAESLLQDINKQFEANDAGYRHKTLSGSAKQFVKSYGWSGNHSRQSSPHAWQARSPRSSTSMTSTRLTHYGRFRDRSISSGRPQNSPRMSARYFAMSAKSESWIPISVATTSRCRFYLAAWPVAAIPLIGWSCTSMEM